MDVDDRVIVTGGKYTGMMGRVLQFHEDGKHAHVNAHASDNGGPVGPLTRLLEISDLTVRRDGTVHVREWVKRGTMQFRCDCLGENDPMHPYNQIIAQGELPEDYGVFISTSTNEHMMRKIEELRGENERLRETIEAAGQHEWSTERD